MFAWNLLIWKKGNSDLVSRVYYRHIRHSKVGLTSCLDEGRRKLLPLQKLLKNHQLNAWLKLVSFLLSLSIFFSFFIDFLLENVVEPDVIVETKRKRSLSTKASETEEVQSKRAKTNTVNRKLDLSFTSEEEGVSSLSEEPSSDCVFFLRFFFFFFQLFYHAITYRYHSLFTITHCCSLSPIVASIFNAQTGHLIVITPFSLTVTHYHFIIPYHPLSSLIIIHCCSQLVAFSHIITHSHIHHFFVTHSELPLAHYYSLLLIVAHNWSPSHSSSLLLDHYHSLLLTTGFLFSHYHIHHFLLLSELPLIITYLPHYQSELLTTGRLFTHYRTPSSLILTHYHSF